VRSSVIFLAAIAAIASAGGMAVGGGGVPPRILALEYYEDREDGFRYNVVATIKGQAEEVRATSGERHASGRLSGHISTTGPGKLWFFRDRRFVKHVRRDLEQNGATRIAVVATNDSGATRKRCRLEFELDPVFGGSATGACRRSGR
jgi:hypothetical protein